MMDSVTLALLVAVVGGIGWLARRAHRRRRLPLTDADVRCPENDSPATVIVRTDPAAATGSQYVDVVACSLLWDAAVRLPARTAYLADAPSVPLTLEPARSACATASPCGQGCVHVLNESAPSVARRPLDCTSGATDAIDLVRQAEHHPSVVRLLWYGG